MQISRDSSGAVVVSGQIVVSQMDAAYHSLETILDEPNSEVILDLTGVEEIDAAGLQLLFALKKSIEEEHSFHIRDLSPAVKEAFSLSGFDIIFREVM